MEESFERWTGHEVPEKKLSETDYVGMFLFDYTPCCPCVSRIIGDQSKDLLGANLVDFIDDQLAHVLGWVTFRT